VLHHHVNAGAAPAGHWTVEPAGRRRIIGEACHFIDLLRFLTGYRSPAASRAAPAARTPDPVIRLSASP